MRKCIVVLLGLAMPALALAQAQKPENNWDNLNRLQVGQKIQIVDTEMKRHEGTFLAYGADAVSIRTSRGDQGFPRDKVVRVSNREKSKRLRNALIGAAIGAGAGLAIGALADRAFTETGERDKMKKFLTPIAAGAGAGIGAGFASYETIYRAPKRTKP